MQLLIARTLRLHHTAHLCTIVQMLLLLLLQQFRRLSYTQIIS
jgi:hypothetical protein